MTVPRNDEDGFYSWLLYKNLKIMKEFSYIFYSSVNQFVKFKYLLFSVFRFLIVVRIRYYLFLLSVFFFSLFFSQCASKGIPGGGPVDKIPPEIIFTSPGADSINISHMENIEIHFSERMDEASVGNSIFISPPLRYKTKWSGGDELRLMISDTLRPDQTYVITIGSAAKDSHGNQMKSSFQFAFSTGSKIDRGEVSGKIYDASVKQSFYIYAYKITDIDSINPSKTKADFLTMPNVDGTFKLSYLADGIYRVFVVEDQNNNLLLDSDYERIGIPYRDISIDSSQHHFSNLYFRITRIDTTPPYIVDAKSINKRTVIVRFTEPVEKPKNDMISIVDSLNLNILPIHSFCRNKDDFKQVIIFTEEQDSSIQYLLNVKGLIDTSGNVQLNDQNVVFQGTARDDTSMFRLIKTFPPDSARNQPLSVRITFEFSVPVDTLLLEENVNVWQNDDSLSNIPGAWQWRNLSGGDFRIIPCFQPGTKYTFQTDTKNIQSIWGDALPDSIIISDFFTVSEDEFGSLSGTCLMKFDPNKDVYVYVFPLKKGQKIIKVKVDPTSHFRIKWLESGKYKLGGFIDNDRNGKYSYGNLFPFCYSEPYYIMSDTIRIRKRWEISDIEFNIPGIEMKE